MMISREETTGWTDGVVAGSHPPFVAPPRPDPGEPARVAIRIPHGAPIVGIDARTLCDGASCRTPMERLVVGDADAWWYATIATEGMRAVQWHFVLYTPDGPYFCNQSGVHSVPPTEDHDFVLLPGASVPEWVAGAVFYQIYPDRFYDGNPDVGRRAGEYRFDGGEPIVMNWEDTPLEFDAGRCQDFFNGDLDGIRRKLDYLEDLGVTALYVTPIFAARTTHRYDCIDYFSVDAALGGDDALAALTTALHERGMRLVVDVSINHTGSDHPWFHDHPEYYYRDPDGTVAYWFGVPTLPQLNYGSPALQAVIWGDPDALVRHWLVPPFEIDGWRFDVGNMTARRGADQRGHDVWRAVRRAVKATKADAWIVGEHWEDNIDYLLGDQWDGAMNYFGCALPIRRWLGEITRFEHRGADFPPSRMPRAVSGRELMQMIQQHYARLPGEIAVSQLNVLDTHDIHRVHHHSAIFDWERYRGAVMLQFLLPGAPSIWYGDEVGIPGHADSVEGCRFPMEWRSDRWDRRFRALYRGLARLASRDAVLARGTMHYLAADDTHLAVARVGWNEGYAWVLILNRAEGDAEYRCALGPLSPGVGAQVEELVLDAAGSNGDGPNGDGPNENALVPARDITVDHELRTFTVPLPARRSRLVRVPIASAVTISES